MHKSRKGHEQICLKCLDIRTKKILKEMVEKKPDEKEECV